MGLWDDNLKVHCYTVTLQDLMLLETITCILPVRITLRDKCWVHISGSVFERPFCILVYADSAKCLLILSVEMIFYFDGFANGQINKIS